MAKKKAEHAPLALKERFQKRPGLAMREMTHIVPAERNPLASLMARESVITDIH